MLLHLAESGLIVQREGRWVSDFTLDEVGIPEGIREVVGRRLSRLSDDANTALSVAAVIGPEFDADLVAALGDLQTDDVFDALDEAVRASILREVKGRFGRYAFAHALVRSTLYEELSTNRRVRMHWRVGEAIEARHPDDLDAHLDALAHHFSEGALAGDPQKAVDVGRRAATKALGDLAFEAAARHLDRVFGSLELVASPDPALRYDLLLELGAALRAADDPRKREVGFAAVDTARSMGDPIRVAEAAVAMTGAVTSRAGNVDEELVALLRSALAGLDDAPSPLRARLMCGLGVELFWGPEKPESRRLSTEGLAMARETCDPQALKAALLGSWTRIDGSEPLIDLMRVAYEEAADQAWDDPVSNFTLHRGLLASAGATGDGDGMHRHLTALREIAEQLRQPRYMYIAQADLAMVHAFTGDLATAEQVLVDAMTHALGLGVDEGTVMSFVGSIFYMVRRGQGRIDELTPAIENLVETQPGAPVWRVALAGTLSESGRVAEAVPHTQYLAADGCANVPTDVEYPVTLCGLARLSRTVPLDEADLRYVYDHLRPFAGTYNWSGISLTDANDHGLAVAAARLGDVAASDAHFAAAIALGERSGARPYLAGARLDWARMLAERGEATAAAEQARAALALGEAIGSDGPFGLVASVRALLDDLEHPRRS
jgi:hypothetical protein